MEDSSTSGTSATDNSNLPARLKLLEDHLAIARNSIHELTSTIKALAEEIKIYRGSWPGEVTQALTKWSAPFANPPQPAGPQTPNNPNQSLKPPEGSNRSKEPSLGTSQLRSSGLKHRFVRFLDTLKESTLKHNRAADEYDEELALDMERMMMTGSDLMEGIDTTPRQTVHTVTVDKTNMKDCDDTGTVNNVSPLRVCPDPEQCRQSEEIVNELMGELCRTKVERAEIQAELISVLNVLENVWEGSERTVGLVEREERVRAGWEGVGDTTRVRLEGVIRKAGVWAGKK